MGRFNWRRLSGMYSELAFIRLPPPTREKNPIFWFNSIPLNSLDALLLVRRSLIIASSQRLKYYKLLLNTKHVEV